MPAAPVFTITYWGVTGTLCAPLRPDEVTDKVVHSIHQLLEQGKLAELRPGPGCLEMIRRQVEESLPFYLRSTFGGNTTCVEVQAADGLFILDCGSGCRELGIALQQRWDDPGFAGAREAHVLLTHPHMDHTFATPYVDPFFDPRNQFTVWGSRALLDSFTAILSLDAPLSQTFFPPTFELLKALKAFREVKPDTTLALGSTRVSTLALNHPGGCLAYRLENAGKAFVFATDHEHPEVPDRKLAEFARGADLLYLDGQYLEAEYEGRQPLGAPPAYPRRGWGHSPVESSVVTAVAAGVRALHIGHRDPKRNDENIFKVEQYVRQCLRDELHRAGREMDSCTALIPYEGLTVRI